MGWSFECAGDLKLMDLGSLIHRKSCIYIAIPRRKVYRWGLNQPLLITFAVFWRLVRTTLGGNYIVLWPVVDHLSRKEPNLLRLAGDRCPVGWSSIRCVVVGSSGTIRVGNSWEFQHNIVVAGFGDLHCSPSSNNNEALQNPQHLFVVETTTLFQRTRPGGLNSRPPGPAGKSFCVESQPCHWANGHRLAIALS